MRVLMLAGALGLAGCSSTPPQGSGRAGAPAAPATPTAPIAPSGPLAGEARWLQSLFAGTPVQVLPERDGALSVEVPLGYAFDGDGATPKAPLKAVLDKLALSLYRQPSARVHLGPPGPAARERLTALRGYLGAKGVAPQRMLATAPAQPDQLLLRLTPAPAAIERLDDASLPPQPVAPAANKAVVPTAPPRATFRPPSGSGR